MSKPPSAADITREANRRRRATRSAVLPGLGASDVDHRTLMLDYPQHDVRDALGLDRASPDTVIAAEHFTQARVAEIEELARALWPSLLPEDWKIRWRLDWHRRRNRSRGGRYKPGWRDEVFDPSADREPWCASGSGISIVGSRIAAAITQPDDIRSWPEYDLLSGSPATAGVDDVTAVDVATLCLIHECSHGIQSTPSVSAAGRPWWKAWATEWGIELPPPDGRDTPWYQWHGPLFAAIYGTLRICSGFWVPNAFHRNEEHSRAGRPLELELQGFCSRCSAPIMAAPSKSRRGRQWRYCSPACRQADYRDRRAAANCAHTAIDS